MIIYLYVVLQSQQVVNKSTVNNLNILLIVPKKTEALLFSFLSSLLIVTL
jgi:hypothetical protein